MKKLILAFVFTTMGGLCHADIDVVAVDSNTVSITTKSQDNRQISFDQYFSELNSQLIEATRLLNFYQQKVKDIQSSIDLATIDQQQAIADENSALPPPDQGGGQ